MLLVAVLCAACGSRPVDPPPPPPTPIAAPAIDARAATLLDGVTQLVVGVADGWDATTAVLQRYQRDGDAWRAVGEPVPAVLGAGGIAWGRGLHGDSAPAGRAGPVKTEGDDRSPAGAYRLIRAFGYAATDDTALPYQRLAESWRCIDDPASAHYNQVLDARDVVEDWSSAEPMRGYGELYRWVIEVEHNATAAPGAGSCIFLHVWGGADDPTVGCTAMPLDDLETLLAWVRPGTVYVLLPAADHAALAAPWGLP